MNITALGIDIAKNVFELHGVNERGKVVLKKSLTRKKLVEFMAQLPPCLVGIEACGVRIIGDEHYQKWGIQLNS